MLPIPQANSWTFFGNEYTTAPEHTTTTTTTTTAGGGSRGWDRLDRTVGVPRWRRGGGGGRARVGGEGADDGEEEEEGDGGDQSTTAGTDTGSGQRESDGEEAEGGLLADDEIGAVPTSFGSRWEGAEGDDSAEDGGSVGRGVVRRLLLPRRALSMIQGSITAGMNSGGVANEVGGANRGEMANESSLSAASGPSAGLCKQFSTLLVFRCAP